MSATATTAYLSIPKQLEALQARGMEINDRMWAERQLGTIGYYRLSGYWHPFKKRDQTGLSQTAPDFMPSFFMDGTSFDQAVALYRFDRRLRLLFLDAIERIEVALRVDIALLLGQRDPWAHRKVCFLNKSFTRTYDKYPTSRHEDWLEKQDSLAKRSRQDFAVKYRASHKGHLPLWMAIEVWDFGLMSRLLGGLKNKDQDAIATKYNLPRRSVLTSAVRAINFARNVCAHHSRLWNIAPVVRPGFPKTGECSALEHLVTDKTARTRIYAHAAIIQHFLSTIDPDNDWASRLKTLMGELPESHAISAATMGFPKNWQNLELWKPEKNKSAK